MQLDLSGRTALVTGSTGGIGRAVAADLARAGARVVVNGRTEPRVDAAVTHLRDETGGEVVGVVADVATAEGAAEVAAREPHVDVLVTTWASSARSPPSRSATTTGGATSRSTCWRRPV